MSKLDPYLQFPLSLLAFESTVENRLNCILDYAVVDAGIKLWRKVAPALQTRLLDAFERCANRPKGFQREITLHCAAHCGADQLKVGYSDISFLLKNYQRVADYVAKISECHGNSPMVRIKQQWFFKVRDRKGLTYREFAVLCAIYSCLGKKAFSRITQARIRRCALGYKTQAVMDAEMFHRSDGAIALPDRPLRDTISRLHRNHFFARSTYARRFTYYSNRLDTERLRNRIVELHSYPNKHRARAAVEDHAMTEAIRKAKKASATAQCRDRQSPRQETR